MRITREDCHVHRWLYLILPAAFILRLLWVLNVKTAPVFDFLKYHLGAMSIAQGMGYKLYGSPTAFEPIGYPAFLALLYSTIAPRLIVPKLMNVLMSLGIIVLAYFLGKRLFNKTVGVLTAAFLALSPRNIAYTSVLSNEIFFTFFFLLALLIIVSRGDRKWSGPVLGVVSGILALTKPFMLLFPGVLFLIDWVWRGSLGASLKKAAVIALFTLLAISPWTVRNYIVFKEFIPISTNGGITLYLNNNPYANGHWQDPFKFPNSPLAKYKNEETGFWDELAVDKLGKQLAREWILEHPGEFIRLGFKKLYYVYNDAWDVYYAVEQLTDGKPLANRTWVYRTARYAYYALLGMLALYLLVLPRALWRGEKVKSHLVLLINIAFFSGIYFVFEGQPRYIFPLLPLFAMMAAWAVGSIFAGNHFSRT
ncbi:ArnT family glycosyltransferase [Zhaonella formicivorans]|uniref:ArnT family glycosyltransferase n=1 Tax=Zhaonella formicivorans TaxID=2528593 RepID=UPI001D11A753|nr:glycosyltransferase family 39 protein [Zhaonella formicivorans]